MNAILLILGMMVVTYIPRYLPFLAFSRRQTPRLVKRFLRCIPYAALGALILPGAVTAIPSYPLVAMVGIAAAIICAWIRKEIILTVLISVTVTFLILSILKI
ncbi:MAG: AzlD domain-containing protein [Candidatus Atribacteria bacterium]|nr:AzlD domain-containing protein [Candidatus Atribacteria bacterium]